MGMWSKWFCWPKEQEKVFFLRTDSITSVNSQSANSELPTLLLAASGYVEVLSEIER